MNPKQVGIKWVSSWNKFQINQRKEWLYQKIKKRRQWTGWTNQICRPILEDIDHNTTAWQSESPSPETDQSSVETSSSATDDLNFPIDLRKGIRSCTKEPISISSHITVSPHHVAVLFLLVYDKYPTGPERSSSWSKMEGGYE